MIRFITVVRKRCLSSASLVGVQASSGIPYVIEMESYPLQIPTEPLTRVLPLHRPEMNPCLLQQVFASVKILLQSDDDTVQGIADTGFVRQQILFWFSTAFLI